MSTKRVTIKDIANTLGVSLAIINRALNDKPGVSPELRKKILETAENLGYRVNKVAQSMARTAITIGIVIPDEWIEYFSVLNSGIKKELDRLLDYNVESKYYNVCDLHSCDATIKSLEACLEDNVSGIVLCDVFPTGLEEILDKIKEAKIPLVTIGQNQSTNKLCLSSVQVDAYRSGKMAAEMLDLFTGDNRDSKNVVVFVGTRGNDEHRLKIDGFTDYADTSPLKIAGIYETHDDDKIATQISEELISKGDSIDGIYIATANSIPICKAFSNLGKKIKIVSTDIYDELAQYLNNGIIQCTLFQDPEKQGRTAIQILYKYLAEHKLPAKNVYVNPQIIVRSNLESLIDSDVPEKIF